MLNEPASSLNDHPVVRTPTLKTPDQDDRKRGEIRMMIETVMYVDTETFEAARENLSSDSTLLLMQSSGLVATFEGRLIYESEAAYASLDEQFARQNLLALFREKEGKHIIHVLQGRVNPQPRAAWINAVLFVVTLFCVVLVGMNLAISEILSQPNIPAAQLQAQAQAVADNFLLNLWRGLPYALSVMLILGAHEMGHYFAARRHKLAVTLPYFIPFPPPFSPFGTLGAFIQLRQPMRNRKVLLEVGAAGPLAGLIFAVPILLIGLAHTSTLPVGGPGNYEGDSVLYAAAKIITFGHFLPDGEKDVCIDCNQLAWAGWTGLLITGLNLIPIGQLDGGHVLYSLIGERAKRLYYPLIGAMIVVVLLFSSTMWLMLILLLIFGRIYATPLDMITPLSKGHRWVAVFSLVVFALVFVPAPLTPMGGSGVVVGVSLVSALASVVMVRAHRWG